MTVHLDLAGRWWGTHITIPIDGEVKDISSSAIALPGYRAAIKVAGLGTKG